MSRDESRSRGPSPSSRDSLPGSVAGRATRAPRAASAPPLASAPPRSSVPHSALPTLAPLEAEPRRRDGRIIRDSFTMPEVEYASFARLERRAMRLGIKTAKTSFIRAGIHALETMDDAQFAALVRGFSPLKPGRKTRRPDG